MDLVDIVTDEVLEVGVRVEEIDGRYFVDEREVSVTVFPADPDLLFVGNRHAYAPAGLFP